MEGLRIEKDEEKRGSLRSRLVLLVALPAAILGITYFLFVEYVLENMNLAGPGVRLVLRLGGLILVLLALVLAATCGYLLVDRVTRPIRLLLRLAETGELPAAAATFLHHREWEIFELYRRVNVLMHQNQSGARAVEELERLRPALVALRQELSRTGQHGIMAPVQTGAEGVLGEIAACLQANRERLLQYLREVGWRVFELREEIRVLGEGLGLDRSPEEHVLPKPTLEFTRARNAMERLRRNGTVMALEAERVAGSPGRRVGDLFDRVQEELRELEKILESLESKTSWGRNGPSAAVVTGATSGLPDSEPVDELEARRALREKWYRLMENLGSLERRLSEVEER